MNLRILFGRRLALIVVVLGALFAISSIQATPSGPPYWDGGTGDAVHYAPQAWPGDASWISYTRFGSSIDDQRTQDPSNGGTSPQNIANVSSNCPDTDKPSVAYYFDGTTVFYRWRVESQPNTYATGPNAGTFATSDPWNSAQWTVLIDTDGDGYREFAVHLNGSSG